MKRLALICLLFTTFFISAQKIKSKVFKLSTGVEKKVKIFLPRGIENDTIHKYPITVVLNDDYLFDMTVGNAKLFANADLAPRQIVVGIPTNREENKDISIVEKSQGLTTNSTAFYNFIKDDLIKYLKAAYKGSPFTTVVADRKAANFAKYFIDEREPVFNSYILLDPSFTKEATAKFQSYNLSKLADKENSYFIYLTTSPFINKEEKTVFTELKTVLTSYDAENLHIQINENKEALNGVSNVCEGIPQAFSHSFNGYRRITKKEYNEKIKELAPLAAIEYLENKYIDMNFLYGTNKNVRIKDFYAIENIIIDQEDGDRLSVLGDFALIKHPDSPLGDYYMGKYYEKGKDYVMALDYFKVGYGKMDPADPKIDAFYLNVERVQGLVGSEPKEESSGDEKEKEEDEKEEEEEDYEEDYEEEE